MKNRLRPVPTLGDYTTLRAEAGTAISIRRSISRSLEPNQRIDSGLLRLATFVARAFTILLCLGGLGLGIGLIACVVTTWPNTLLEQIAASIACLLFAIVIFFSLVGIVLAFRDRGEKVRQFAGETFLEIVLRLICELLFG